MKLRQTLLEEHSKTNCTRIVKWIGNNPQRFDELFRLFLRDEALVRQRAAWPLGDAAIAHPELMKKHFGALLKNLSRKDLHTAEKRNTVRMLQELELPLTYHGRVMDICFASLLSPGEKPAMKAYSLSVLHKLSRQYPDISNELRTIIKTKWDQESPAFRSRGAKILERLPR